MRALITGATGYIGYYLATTLVDQEWEVHAIVRPHADLHRLASVGLSKQCHVYDGGISSLVNALEKAKPDTVFHLAADTKLDHRLQDVDAIISANVLFGSQLLEAMAQTGHTAFVNTGTYSEYDSEGGYSPNTLYAASKRAFQDVITYYALKQGIRAVTLVLFDVYGSGDWRKKVISQLVDALGNGCGLGMTEGVQLLDLVYITDVIRGFVRAAEILAIEQSEDPYYPVFCLDTGNPRTLREIVQMFESLSGSQLEVRWGALPYRKSQIFRPISCGIRLPGWSAAVSLEEGLRRILSEEIHAAKFDRRGP